jgi:copper chaperone NosL
MIGRAKWLVAAVLAAGCAGSAPGPAEIDTRNTACEHCGMVVSDRRTAAQVVAPGEEPVFFDDLGCLASWLKARHGSLAPKSGIYVADHRTKDWLAADRAIYTRVPGLETPMGSGIVAHATAASRDEDRSVARGVPVPAREILGATLEKPTLERQ